MSTDNWPVNFTYISQRLTKEIAQQDEAARLPIEMSAKLRLAIFSMVFKTRKLDYGNRYALARKATSAVESLTGTVELPGEYVKATADVLVCDFPVFMGWKDTFNAHVAAIVLDGSRDSERTFVALFGSVANFLGYKAGGDSVGWTPSDFDGLYRLIDSSREPGDPEIDPEALQEDDRHDDMSRLETAWRVAGRSRTIDHLRQMEFLAKVHLHVHDVSILGEHFEHFLVGAPVWVATPAPISLYKGQPRDE